MQCLIKINTYAVDLMYIAMHKTARSYHYYISLLHLCVPIITSTDWTNRVD